MILGKTLSFAQPQFPHLQNSDTDSREAPVCCHLWARGLGRGLGWRDPRLLTLSFCSLCPQPSEFEEEATQRVDDLLESYMGIRDPELGKGPG